MPDVKVLYLKPKRIAPVIGGFLYTAVPLGVKQLSQMLPRKHKEVETHTFCIQTSNPCYTETVECRTRDQGDHSSELAKMRWLQ